jgi:flagellar hook-associated protein 2
MTSVSSTTSTSTNASASATATSSSKTAASTDTSNIDWDAIIEASVQAKLDKADTIDLKITSNEAKISAYQDLQSLLETLVTTAPALRAPSGTL